MTTSGAKNWQRIQKHMNKQIIEINVITEFDSQMNYPIYSIYTHTNSHLYIQTYIHVYTHSHWLKPVILSELYLYKQLNKQTNKEINSWISSMVQEMFLKIFVIMLSACPEYVCLMQEITNYISAQALHLCGETKAGQSALIQVSDRRKEGKDVCLIGQ